MKKIKPSTEIKSGGGGFNACITTYKIFDQLIELPVIR
jgi:hypothetical protein